MVPVARAFLDAFARLQLTPAEAVLILFLVAARNGDGHPHPSLEALSGKLGVDPRTVRSWARRLEARGLMVRVIRRKGHGRTQTNLWDLTPLFERLEEFERKPGRTRKAEQP